MTRLNDTQVKVFEDFIVTAVDNNAVAKGQNTRFMLIGATKALQAAGIQQPDHWELWIMSGKEIYAAIQERRTPPVTQPDQA